MEENKKITNLGPITGIIVVIIVLLVGAFYFAGQRIEKSKEFQAAIQKELATTSDEIADIDSAATSMNFDNLGGGIDNL